MKKRGHYCKVCGEYKANEKFSGKGHAAHICKTCAALPHALSQSKWALTRLVNLPWRLSKEQLSWLKKRMKDRRDAVRTLATEQYEMRFPPRIELDELEDDFEEDFDFYMDEETDIDKPMRSVISRPLIFWKGGGPHMATTPHYTAAHRQGPHGRQGDQRYHWLCKKSRKDRPRQAHHQLPV